MSTQEPSAEERTEMLRATAARMDPETYLLPEDQGILDFFGQTHKALAALEDSVRQALALTEDPEVRLRLEGALHCARLVPSGIVTDVKARLLAWHQKKN